MKNRFEQNQVLSKGASWGASVAYRHDEAPSAPKVVTEMGRNKSGVFGGIYRVNSSKCTYIPPQIEEWREVVSGGGNYLVSSLGGM